MEKTGKKTSGKKKSSARKKKKAKVYIPLNSIISLCAVIVGLCTALLILYSVSVSAKSSSEKKQTAVVKTAPERKENSGHKELKPPAGAQEKAPAAKKPAESPKVSPGTKSPETKSPETSSPEPKKKAPAEKKPAVQTPSDEKKSAAEKKTPAQEQGSKPEVKSPEKSSSGQQKSQEEKSVVLPPKKASDIPSIPPAVNGARIVIIFDDGGQNLAQLEKCISLPFPVTVAVLPGLSHSRESAAKVRASGNEVILHQPMQSVNQNVNPGPGAVKPGMGEEEIRRILFQNINEIAPITGMNNHEGSLITADAEKMSYVMKIASDEGLFFLDSRTNVETKVPYVARALGYSYYERNIFLDNRKTRENIISEFMKGLSIANKNGAAIMIGHVWSAEILPGVLAELYPLAKEKGYRFTTVSNSGALITP